MLAAPWGGGSGIRKKNQRGPIRSFGGEELRTPTNERSATTMPDVPTGLSATPGDAQVSLVWSANSDGVTTSYDVLASDDGGSSLT